MGEEHIHPEPTIRRRVSATSRPVPPIVACRGCCGRTRRTWVRSWLCRWCLLEDRAASPESFRATRRRFAGLCPVCGLSPCGCEFGPKVVA